MSFSLSGQVTITPRVSYNWANYRVNDCFSNPCPNTRSNIGVGLNAYRELYKDLSIVAGVNFYTNKITYPDGGFRLGNTEFRHFDFKMGIENNIFNKRTKVGAGIQMEIMYNIRDIDNRTNEVINHPLQRYFGFELTASHKFRRVEIFYDAFFNLGIPSSGVLYLLYHTNFQIGVGYPLVNTKSKFGNE